MIKNERGLTLVEIVLVSIIVVTAGTLATVSMNAGIENREAKQVASSLQSVAHAIKMYQLENDGLPADLQPLIDQGYLKSEELALMDKYDYRLDTGGLDPQQWSIEAEGPKDRLLSAQRQLDGTLIMGDTRGYIPPDYNAPPPGANENPHPH